MSPCNSHWNRLTITMACILAFEEESRSQSHIFLALYNFVILYVVDLKTCSWLKRQLLNIFCSISLRFSKYRAEIPLCLLTCQGLCSPCYTLASQKARQLPLPHLPTEETQPVTHKQSPACWVREWSPPRSEPLGRRNEAPSRRKSRTCQLTLKMVSKLENMSPY